MASASRISSRSSAAMTCAAEPIRVFRGWVDEVKIRTGEVGGSGEATVTLASAARGLTRVQVGNNLDAHLALLVAVPLDELKIAAAA
jgi:hypothetical protein